AERKDSASVIKRRRRLSVGAVVILVAMTGIALWLTNRHGAERPASPAWDDFAITQLTSESGVERFPSLSPDGRWIVYQSDASGNPDIYLQAVGGKTSINLTKDTTEGDYTPQFSPDGERIVFDSARDGGGLFIMGRTGESPRRLTDTGCEPTWSADGREVAYVEPCFGVPELRG